MKRIFITLIIAIITQLSLAQTFDQSKLDRYFSVLESNNKFMGSVAVSKNGKIVYTNSIGYADIENMRKANDSTKYRTGSISKTFTAVLVLKGAEEKKLVLDQTIDKYFPKIKNSEKITIKQLLRHRSGIHNFTDDAGYLTWNTEPKTENEMVEIIAKAGSDFEPNSKFAYSNSNYVLLTFILEKAFGKSYQELLQQYITEPLRLKNTFFGGKMQSAQNESKSYSFMGEWKLETETDVSIPLGAGGIVSTPIDLVTFSDALFDGKLLQKESLDKMKAIQDHFGMGLISIPFYDKTGYGHTGGIDGFSSVFIHFADGDISYALTSNGSNYDNNAITIAVLSAVYGKAYDVPAFTAYHVKPEELDQYSGVYASDKLAMKITIRKENDLLMAQATGQPAFPLEATSKDVFQFTQAGVVMQFDVKEKTMLLKQAGMEILFRKES